MSEHLNVVITGATSGLGRLAALELARRGARLGITARSAERSDDIRKEIEAVQSSAGVDVFLGDLGQRDDVDRMADEIRQRFPQVDVLINNAGLHAFEPRTTKDGLPEMVAVNYLAPWLLTQSLLPSLHAAKAGRVVNVASEASRRHGKLRIPEDLTDISPFSAIESSQRYAKTKLLDIMFTFELARRIDGSSVVTNCLDPGFNVTGLGRELRFAGALESVLSRLGIGNPAKGSDLIVDLAVTERFGEVSGRYVTAKGSREIVPASPAIDPHACSHLWQETEKLLGL